MSRLHSVVFFFKKTATTEIYALSLHDALPIYWSRRAAARFRLDADDLHQEVCLRVLRQAHQYDPPRARSEEHTSELQSRQYLVCRLLLEKIRNVLIRLPSSLPLVLPAVWVGPL